MHDLLRQLLEEALGRPPTEFEIITLNRLLLSGFNGESSLANVLDQVSHEFNSDKLADSILNSITTLVSGYEAKFNVPSKLFLTDTKVAVGPEKGTVGLKDLYKQYVSVLGGMSPVPDEWSRLLPIQNFLSGLANTNELPDNLTSIISLSQLGSPEQRKLLFSLSESDPILRGFISIVLGMPGVPLIEDSDLGSVVFDVIQSMVSRGKPDTLINWLLDHKSDILDDMRLATRENPSLLFDPQILLQHYTGTDTDSPGRIVKFIASAMADFAKEGEAILAATQRKQKIEITEGRRDAAELAKMRAEGLAAIKPDVNSIFAQMGGSFASLGLGNRYDLSLMDIARGLTIEAEKQFSTQAEQFNLEQFITERMEALKIPSRAEYLQYAEIAKNVPITDAEKHRQIQETFLRIIAGVPPRAHGVVSQTFAQYQAQIFTGFAEQEATTEAKAQKLFDIFRQTGALPEETPLSVELEALGKEQRELEMETLGGVFVTGDLENRRADIAGRIQKAKKRKRGLPSEEVLAAFGLPSQLEFFKARTRIGQPTFGEFIQARPFVPTIPPNISRTRMLFNAA